MTVCVFVLIIAKATCALMQKRQFILNGLMGSISNLLVAKALNFVEEGEESKEISEEGKWKKHLQDLEI